MSGGDIVRFGKYRLMQRIAAGGMGEVHLAKLKGPSGFEKLVVIKRLLDHRQKQQKYIDMFFSEARVAAQLNHSNIVQIYEVGNADGVHYIAMEYVAGKSLRRIIDATQDAGDLLPVAYTVEIITELCTGLSFAHDARHLSGAPMGLIHRDINPHNVLVSYLGEVKIIDFGIAKSELTMEQTQAGTIKGTVVYMSPEQSSGHKLDRRSDLFSVGICLYEALTGANPFHKDSLTGSLEAIRRCDFPPLLQLRPDLAPFAPVVAKAMARNPEERYQNCTELADALKELVAQGHVPKAPQHLADYLRGLFADDIAEEERLMSQTELAEVPVLGSTETISGLPPEAPEPVSDERTVMENVPHPMADEPTEAHVSTGSPEREPSSNPSRPTTESQGHKSGLQKLWSLIWLRWLLAGCGVLLGYEALAFLLRPPPTPAGIQHTSLPVPPSSVPHPPGVDPNNSKPEPPPTPNELTKPAENANLPTGPKPAPTPPPPQAPTTNEEPPQETAPSPSRRPRHMPPPRPRHINKPQRPTRPEPPPEPANAPVGTVQFHIDPSMRVTLNGASVGSSVRLKASAGTFHMGAGSDPATDPFAVQLHYRIEEKEIIFAVESDPWANVFGAGGIHIGRTPVQGVQGGTVTVFELRNPKMERSLRITVRFIP